MCPQAFVIVRFAPSHGENRGSSPLGSANDFSILAPKLSLVRPASPTFLQWTVLQTINSRVARCPPSRHDLPARIAALAAEQIEHAP